MEIKNKQLIVDNMQINEEELNFNMINTLINKLVRGELSKENFENDDSSPYLTLVINEILDCNIEDDDFNF